jgi:hypothetical protein
MIRYSSNADATRILHQVGFERLAAILQSDRFRLYDPPPTRRSRSDGIMPEGRFGRATRCMVSRTAANAFKWLDFTTC